MRQIAPQDPADAAAIETREWQESLDYVLQSGGPARVAEILSELEVHARRRGLKLPFTANTPVRQHHPRRRADARSPAATRSSAGSRAWSAGTPWRWWSRPTWRARASAATSRPSRPPATLYEVGFNHFFQGKGHKEGGDFVYFQGHASPGMYARAFLEGRLSQQQLENFRRELKPGGGLSSYPHPWLMPDFWEAPTVSMGLGPIMSIYQARFSRYLEDRGLKPRTDQKVWAFLGDGETDEPEVARRHHAGLAREARQPDLRHQLQPAAPRRSGARQRPDHPGTRSDLPRRRLERHQGAVGPRVGRAVRARPRGPAAQARGRGRRRRVPEVLGDARRLHPPAVLRQRPAAAEDGRAPLRRSAEEDARRRPRSREGVPRLQGGDRAQGPAHRHPRPHHQGLRPRRERRRQEHHPPAEEAERRRDPDLPDPLRHPDLRRADQGDARSTGRPRTARRSPTCASAARRSAATCPRGRSNAPSR